MVMRKRTAPGELGQLSHMCVVGVAVVNANHSTVCSATWHAGKGPQHSTAEKASRAHDEQTTNIKFWMLRFGEHRPFGQPIDRLITSVTTGPHDCHLGTCSCNPSSSCSADALTLSLENHLPISVLQGFSESRTSTSQPTCHVTLSIVFSHADIATRYSQNAVRKLRRAAVPRISLGR
jgi:hypothetical protein